MGPNPLCVAAGLEGTVTFCVGGSFFTTQRETLMKEPASRLSLMVRGLLPSSQDAQGVYFVDRGGALRHGS